MSTYPVKRLPWLPAIPADFDYDGVSSFQSLLALFDAAFPRSDRCSTNHRKSLRTITFQLRKKRSIDRTY